MKAIYLKEISSFFSSIIAYVVIGVFLLATGVFLWIIPSTSIFEYGYASLDQLFEIAPWVFMFLIPAVSMRSFAEERKSGTMEIILTKPISDLRIVLAKYLAVLSLVLFALLPSLLYFLTVYLNAAPVGNMDIGGTWGSYIGLFFLAAVYAAIGIFSSAINDNQIISFITALFICFFFQLLLDLLRDLTVLTAIDPVLEYLSIDSHYISMSRGVIDSRDLVYFFSMIGVFILGTKLVMERRKW